MFLLLLLPALLALASCSKAVLDGNGCISTVKRPLNPVGPDNYAKAEALFAGNGLNSEGLSFTGPPLTIPSRLTGK